MCIVHVHLRNLLVLVNCSNRFVTGCFYLESYLRKKIGRFVCLLIASMYIISEISINLSMAELTGRLRCQYFDWNNYFIQKSLIFVQCVYVGYTQRMGR